MGSETPSYKGFRFPAEIIAHGVWLYRQDMMVLAADVTLEGDSVNTWFKLNGIEYGWHPASV